MADFAKALREEDVEADPFRQFALWFEEAAEAGERAPEAAAVATAGGDGAPSVRMVLVKQTAEPGFVFFSNYESRKGRELAANPQAALLFHWDLLGRQVRLEGRVERLSPDESAAYVRGRPRGSQLSALASRQSRTIAGREELERRVQELDRRFGEDAGGLPVPAFWGGYRLVPDSFEFWQHREDRLHDRLLYTRAATDADADTSADTSDTGAEAGRGGWRLERLSP